MANTLKGFRLPEATLAQLAWLIEQGHGNQSQVVIKAIDRLYQEHQRAARAPNQGRKGESNEGLCRTDHRGIQQVGRKV